MIRTLGALVAIVVMTSVLSSCIAIGGTQNDHRPTAGQELVDLKTALDKGAITQEEYDKKKALILGQK